MHRLLDARSSLDPRNADYPIRPLLAVRRPPRSHTWRLGREVLNQGADGACVGHAWAHELAARPRVVPVESADAFRIYRHAQTIDEWPGEQYSGTSVLAGAKAVQALYPGRLTEYRWAESIDDVIRSVGSHGPVVLAVPWLTRMFQPDSDGMIAVEGFVEGWHAVIANAVSIPLRRLTITNSWGPDWGLDGTCRLDFDGLLRLLELGAEVCVPVRR